MAEYIKQANQERLVIYQIETPEVINDVEAIAEMEGVDALFFWAWRLFSFTRYSRSNGSS